MSWADDDPNWPPRDEAMLQQVVLSRPYAGPEGTGTESTVLWLPELQARKSAVKLRDDPVLWIVAERWGLCPAHQITALQRVVHSLKERKT